MSIGNINKSVCDDRGETNAIHCPACGKEIKLKLYSVNDKSLFAAVMKKSSALTFAVCPSCSAVYSVKDNYISAREAGNTVFLDENDITPLKRSL